MSFGLKNVGMTCQRIMSFIFEPILGKSMESYIDDMMVKSQLHEDHLTHLRVAFQLMRLHHLRSNLDKWAFRVESRNFLRFLVSIRGIEMAPD